MADMNQIQTVGRRKTSVARVLLRPGSGALKVNGRNNGFTLKTQHPDVLESRANRAAASAPGGTSRSLLPFTSGAY